MKLISNITEQNINPDAPVIETADFWQRRAARAVVFDEKGYGPTSSASL